MMASFPQGNAHCNGGKMKHWKRQESEKMKQAGFSMVEMMVAVIIFGILTAVAVPGFRSLTKTNQITSQANDFISALNLARSEAIKRGRLITIAATSATSANEFGAGWSLTAPNNASGTETIRVYSALKGSNTLDSTDNVSSFQFAPTGFLVPSGAVTSLTFNLCQNTSGQPGRQIVIKSTGRASNVAYTCP
jgi:type IV fimbrial biogenesis protein FimT